MEDVSRTSGSGTSLSSPSIAAEAALCVAKLRRANLGLSHEGLVCRERNRTNEDAGYCWVLSHFTGSLSNCGFGVRRWFELNKPDLILFTLILPGPADKHRPDADLAGSVLLLLHY